MVKYTPETFNQNKYKRTGWVVILGSYESDNYELRLIVRVATGRKYWPLFSEIIDLDKGINDPAISNIEKSLYGYTFPMIERFISELEIMISDLYQTKIILKRP